MSLFQPNAFDPAMQYRVPDLAGQSGIFITLSFFIFIVTGFRSALKRYLQLFSSG